MTPIELINSASAAYAMLTFCILFGCAVANDINGSPIEWFRLFRYLGIGYVAMVLTLATVLQIV